MFKSLQLTDVKSYQDVDIEFDPSVTILTGVSGHGKSNLLAALNWIRTGKPNKNKVIRRKQGRAEAVLTLEDGVSVHRYKAVKGGDNGYMICRGDGEPDAGRLGKRQRPPGLPGVFNRKRRKLCFCIVRRRQSPGQADLNRPDGRSEQFDHHPSRGGFTLYGVTPHLVATDLPQTEPFRQRDHELFARGELNLDGEVDRRLENPADGEHKVVALAGQDGVRVIL